MRQFGRNFLNFELRGAAQVFTRIVKRMINEIKLIDRSQHGNSPGSESHSGYSGGTQENVTKVNTPRERKHV